MKTLIWALTALLLAGWTGLVWLAQRIAGWLLTHLDAASLGQAGGSVASLPLPPLPAWLSPWFDTAGLAELQAWAAGALGWLGAVLPAGDTLMAWVGPLLWVGWGLGALVLLALAVLLHLLVGRGAALRSALPSVGSVRA